jgi:hypothetical protein
MPERSKRSWSGLTVLRDHRCAAMTGTGVELQRPPHCRIAAQTINLVAQPRLLQRAVLSAFSGQPILTAERTRFAASLVTSLLPGRA